MNIKRIFSFTLPFLVITILCQHSIYGQEHRSDTLLFLADAGYPPFEFADNNGNAVGFNIDLTKALMKRLGISKYKIKAEQWSKLIEDYDNGIGDFLTGIMYTRNRAEKYLFGPAHNNLKLNIVYRKRNTPVKSLSEISDKKVMVERSSQAHEVLLNIGLNKEIVPVSYLEEGLIKLSNGENDAVVCDKEVALYYINKYKLNNLIAKDIGMPWQAFCFVGRDNLLLQRLDSVLVIMRSDGSYRNLADKWHIQPDSSKKSTDKYWIIGSFLIVACLVFFLVFLRKKIIKTRDELDKKNNRLALALKAGEVTVWGYDVKSEKFFNVECDYFPPSGQPFDKEVMFFHPDDRPLFISTMKSLCRGEEPPKRLCFRLNHKGFGEWEYTEKEFVPIKDKTGRVVTIIGTHRNVTHIYLMQEKLKELVRRADYAIKSADMTLWELTTDDMNFTTYNDPLTHYKDGKKTPADKYLDLMKLQDVKGLKETIETINSRSPKNLSCNVRFWINDQKKWHYGIITGAPFVIDKDGHTLKYVGFRRDISELIEAQENLIKEMERAKQADKLKSAFVANMSHEIRTPLNAIVGFSNLLPTEEDPNAKKEYAKLINTSSNMLLRLINDILDLSKIEAGVIEMTAEAFDMSLCFNQTIASLKTMEHSNVPLIPSNPYKKCIVISDKNRISQIIVNFVSNAIKYTPSGTISASYSYENGGVKVTVTDTGIGIAKEKQYLIFRRFEKLDDFAQGTGLGLSICKAITDNCGGKIGFSSEHKKGSTFWAWIPCTLKEPIEPLS